MKTFRELYFKGTSEQLTAFADQIGEYAVGNWKLAPRTDRFKNYLSFEYEGGKVDKAIVSIYLGERISEGKLEVGNIVPMEKSKLSVDEYNAVLLKFYDDIIKPYKEQGTELDISQPSDDIFDPTTVISETALNKLKLFCLAANKSTGSSHPCDRERWFDFICQTVDDGKIFDFSMLGKFLQDETYWGNKPEGAWDEENAFELASEYTDACEVLQYYIKTRGL